MSVDISFKAEIGNNAYFGHDGLGVIITSKAKIGDNFKAAPHIVIGLITTEDPHGPIIGHNVWIGAGAKILGPIQIGNNVKIGANAVVLKDIPDNSTAVGIPAKIITE